MRRIGILLITALSLLVLMVELYFIWNGYFLPEPQYIVNSYSDLLMSELTLSLKNLIIYIFMLFLPLYFVSFFFKEDSKIKFSFKRFIYVLVLVGLISIFFITRSIQESIQLWKPLDQATKTLEQRTFSRGRGGGLGLQKRYSVEFTVRTNNLLFLRQEIISGLSQQGYSIRDFSVRIDGQRYLSGIKPNSTDILLQNIDLVPFETSLKKLDSSSVIFQNKNPYEMVQLSTNYNEDGMVRGFLVSYY